VLVHRVGSRSLVWGAPRGRRQSLDVKGAESETPKASME